MPWTDRSPQHSGHYFARSGPGADPQIVELVRHAVSSELYPAGSQHPVSVDGWEWWCREDDGEPQPIDVPF